MKALLAALLALDSSAFGQAETPSKVPQIRRINEEIRRVWEDHKLQPSPPATGAATRRAREIGGPKGPEPTRYGDWEVKGRCSDF
jgi:hypothetical protein